MHNRELCFNEPFTVQWHITDNCNLYCKHCYRNEEKCEPSSSQVDYILKSIFSFLESNKFKGRFHLAGGEPLLSPFIIDIIRTLSQNNILIRLLSNGTVVDRNLAKDLFAAGLRYAQISLEGCEETNNLIRGSGTYEDVINGAIRLKEAGIEVTFAMTLSKLNLNEIESFISDNTHIAKRFYFTRLIPTRDEHFPIVLSKEEWLSAMRRILKVKDIEIPLRDPTFCGFFFSPYKASKINAVMGCSAGYNSVAIESNGDVYPCRRLPIVIGNMYEEDFSEIWKSNVLSALRNRDNLKGKCGSCSYRWLCGGCRGVSYAFQKDYMGEDSGCPLPISKTHEKLAFLPSNRKLLSI